MPQIRQIQPYTKSYVKLISYRNRLQKTGFQLGEKVEQTTSDKRKVSPLEPGLLHRTCYLIGLNVIPADESSGMEKKREFAYNT